MMPAVLIVMVGFDYQRILDGVRYWNGRFGIRKIYLLYDRKRDKYGEASRRNARDLKNDLKIFNPELVPYNPQSYEETFITLYKLIRKETELNKYQVLIDSTSTTKEAHGAAITVSLMFQGVRVYVVPPVQRGWYVPELDSNVCPQCGGSGRIDYDQWFEDKRKVPGATPQEVFLPGSRLEKPSWDEERVLLALEAHGGRADSIKSIIEWCGEDPYDATMKNRFGRTVAKLERAGLVESKERSKTKKVALTEFGRILAKAMRAFNAEKQKISNP